MNKVQYDISLLKMYNKNTSTKETKDYLLSRLNKMHLLGEDITNAKLSKSVAQGYKSYILYLSPYKLSGVNLCPKASSGCAAACLNTAGRGRFDSVADARLRKSLFYIKMRSHFLVKLDKEISRLKKKHDKLAIRLNGTSDICFESIKLDGVSLINRHKDIIFYDYTAILNRLYKPIPKNYHITFSRKEDNDAECLEALKLGFNVAAVFKDQPLTYWGYKVISGDEHDLRFLDAKGSIVGLTAKGPAKHDKTNFVILDNITKVA